jgi:two-component system cell cycle sensor histidine kinase PleC
MSNTSSVLSPNPTADQAVPRFVIDHDGRVVFASPAFAQKVQARADALIGSKIQDLIVFCAPETVFQAQDAPPPPGPVDFDDDFPAPDNWSARIVPGVHAIKLLDHNGPPMMFDFQWAQVGFGERFLMGTLYVPALPAPKAVEAEGIQKEPMPIHAALAALAAVAVNDDAPVAFAPKGDGTAPSAYGAFRKILERGARSEGQVFLDLADDVMVRTDMQGQLSTANRAFTAKLGYAPETIPVLNFIDLVVESDRIFVRNVFKGLVHEQGAGDTVDFETRLVGHDVKPHVMHIRLKRQGEKVFILARDLTDMRDREAKLQKHRQQLREAEDIAQMGYFRWAVGSDHLDFSDQTYKIFGVDRSSFTPTIDAVQKLVNRRDAGRMMQTFERAMIGQNDFETEFRLTRPSGEIRYLKCAGKCETDDLGDVTALFGIMHDVTEQTLAERNLRDAKNAAERAYASKSKFLANMSHELRTPLNAIIGFSEMIGRQILGPIGTEKYLEYIDGIRQSGEHLLDLISDILDMSKIEAGKYSLDVEDLNIAKLTRLALNMVEARAADAGITLTCMPFDDDIRVVADRRAMLQMMLNLLSNAIKFTEPGGTVTVSLLTSPPSRGEDDTVRFIVKDTGIGIPADMMAVITTPFEQAANHYTRSHDGSGLGLAITKELAALHGGDLRITSTVGVGTEVMVEIPKQN